MGNEIWMPIKKPVDFSDRYEISNMGRLKRLGFFTKIKKVWKPDLVIVISKADRYMKVALKKGGTIHNFSIHRLVCYAFHDNPENKPQVNHKNGIKHDNRAENLEWCTQSENICHAQSIGIMKYAKPKPPKGKRGRLKGCEGVFKQVIDTSTNIIYKSTQEVSELTGIKFRSLRRALSGERYNRTPYRYYVKGQAINDILLPPPPKVKIIKQKFIRPPKKEYIPHPKLLKKISQFDTAGGFIKEFDCVLDAANSVNSNYDTFRRAIKKSPNNFTKGFIWKYA